MARVPSKDDYLVKPHIPVTVATLVVLLDNVIRGEADPDIGYEGVVRTVEQFKQYLGQHTVLIEEEAVESALWACNLLDEKGKFWHPHSRSFDQFIKSAFPTRKFDRRHNFFKD